MGVSVPLGHGGGSEGWSGSGDQNTLFPLPLPNTAEYKMDMMCLHSVCFKHMPYLPGTMTYLVTTRISRGGAGPTGQCDGPVPHRIRPDI
mmetsp:Transcript_23406/g.33483  ORF Transcript_23406/g.33483 Transcript_23406/m.33483 type:complete len:90 (-) Transcript_23406:2120-2389(-)